MIGMIEHIQGTGLSGSAGKTAKGAKNSLFGKLLAMLEQPNKLTGKSQALHLAKGGKQSVLSGKGDPLFAAKSKHLLALATKTKQHVKRKDDDKATPIVAAHAFIDAAILRKKSDKSGKAAVALQTVHLKGEKMTVAAKQPGQVFTADMSGSTAKQAADSGKVAKPVQGLLVDGKADGKVAAVAPNDGQLASGKSAFELDHGVQKLAQKVTNETKELASVVASGMKTSDKSKGLTRNESGAINPQTAGIGSLQKSDGSRLVNEPIANVTDKSSHVGAEKVILQPGVESAQATVGIQTQKQIQKNKTVQLQQVQAATPSSPSAAAGIAIANMSDDASKGDFGSQFSDKGQDGRNISLLGNDTKTSSSSASSSAHFQQYLSGKSAPSMTLFDSMNHIAQSASKGKTKLEIQLDPAHLGKIQISLQSDAAKQLQVHIIADQSGTRQLIDQQLPQLKSALAQQGFDLSGFSMDSQGQNASSGGDHSQGKRAVSHTAETTIDTVNLIASPNRTASGSGLSIRI